MITAEASDFAAQFLIGVPREGQPTGTLLQALLRLHKYYRANASSERAMHEILKLLNDHSASELADLAMTTNSIGLRHHARTGAHSPQSLPGAARRHRVNAHLAWLSSTDCAPDSKNPKRSQARQVGPGMFEGWY